MESLLRLPGQSSPCAEKVSHFTDAFTRPDCGDVRMSDTQVLLGKLAALRQRLDLAQGLLHDAGSAAVALLEQSAPAEPAPFIETQPDHAVPAARLPDEKPAALLADSPPLTPMTARAARLLPQLQELLSQLRGLA